MNDKHNPQYIGNLKRNLSKGGKEYFKGRVGNVPVVAFWGHKDPDKLNIKLDIGMINWIDQKDDDNQTPNGNRKEENPFG